MRHAYTFKIGKYSSYSVGIIITMKIGLIGAGNIARVIADNARSYEVSFVYDKDGDAVNTFARKYGCEISKPEEFPKLDLVVEAASQDAVGQYSEAILSKGINLMVMSVGALSDDALLAQLRKAAEKSNSKLIIPSGAITGLDGIGSGAVGRLDTIILTTTKNPKSLGVDTISKSLIFEGSAREAVKKFPKNVNVAATLALAGMGFEKTKVRIVADPDAARNQHEIFVKGDFGEMRIRIENLPSPDNPKTSYLAAMSAVAAIKKFNAGIIIG
jgi:aspartate dehydrogenase